MTAPAVADDVLGRFTRRLLDVLGRIVHHDHDQNRVLIFLQHAGEKPPNLTDPSTRTFILESRWSYDHSNTEYVTISVERCDYAHFCYERLIDETLEYGDRERLLRELKELFEKQVPGHGGRSMVRLYQVVQEWSFTGSSGLVDLHFTLQPICDFNNKGEPIPCPTK